MSERGLKISNLHASVGGAQILKGIDLEVTPGSVHALMGPNGSGKSTLAFSMAGHPSYDVTAGSVTLDGEALIGLAPDKRAKAGLFLSATGRSPGRSHAGEIPRADLREARHTRHGRGVPVALRERRVLRR
jgi:Fe-S cluster assembly ATP-binding protein